MASLAAGRKAEHLPHRRHRRARAFLLLIRRSGRFFLRRTPLTLGSSVVIIAMAGRSGALAGATSEAIIQRWGFDLDNLTHGHIFTLATMNLLVFNRSHLFAILFMFWVFLAPLEALAGTRAAAIIFWMSTLGGALLSAMLVGLPGHLLGWNPIPNLVQAADVGASIAGVGAAGGLTVVFERYPGNWGWAFRICLGLFLLTELRSNPGIADFEHIAGFVIGILVAHRLGLDRDRTLAPTAHAAAR